MSSPNETVIPAPGAFVVKPPFLKGCDLSHYQTKLDTKLYPATGHQFLMSKASDGLGSSDSFFHTARTDAQVMGMPFIGYHFFRFAGLTPVEQAKLLFKTFGGLGHKEGIAGDYEWDNQTAKAHYGDGKETDKAGNDLFYAFKSEVEQLFGVPMIIYTGKSFMPMVDERFAKNPLWVFDYHTTGKQTPSANQKPILPPTWKDTGWSFWQYTDREETKGSGAIDMNVFNGDLAKLLTLTKA